MALQLELSQKPFIELQIEALIKENRIKSGQVNDFIDELEARILDIKNINYEKLLDRQFRLPIIGRPNSMNADFPKNMKFVPPQGLEVIGGFRTSTAIKRTSFVDLSVTLPLECIEKKDIKNQKYNQKRAFYLAQLAFILNGFTGSGLVEKLEFKYHQGDFLKPVLLITPKNEKLKKNVTFQLFVDLPADSPFKPSLLHPNHGNVAPKWYFQDVPSGSKDCLGQFLEKDSDAAPSPFYNSSILFDHEIISNSDTLYQQIGTYSSFRDALILIKIWLYQRELQHRFSFIISMFVAYLQTRQAIHQNMSSFQIFKIIIKSVASSQWDSEGLSYFDNSIDEIQKFKTAFPVIFLSPSGALNICYNVSLDLYKRLKHEATLSQAILASPDPNMFDLLFLKSSTFPLKFDVIVHLPKCMKSMTNNFEYLIKSMDHGLLTPQVYADKTIQLLEKALTDRVILIQQSPKHYLSDKRWNFRSIPHNPFSEDSTFTFGLIIDPEKSLRILEIGPQADSADAEEFRRFWEPKSELRLQNGVISETVVWHVEKFSQRRAIIRYILTHALRRVGISNLVVHYTMLEYFINLNNVFFRWRDETYDAPELTNGDARKRKREDQKRSIGIGEEVFQKILHSYNELNKILRSVENLKHMITAIQPISPHMRSSSVFPPLPVSLQAKNKSLKRKRGVTAFPEKFNQTGKILHIEPIEILLTLDSSGKWPYELEAFEAAKLQYLIDLSEALKEKEYCLKITENYLDVMYGQFVFRLRVKCQRELNLVGPSCGKHELQKRRLELEVLPRVHAALDQLYRERLAFGLTCRLVKRWTSCHLMTDHVTDVALDLMVAHLFLHPQPYTEPASSSCGFKRFLMLMAQHDWESTPLVINFDHQLKLDEINRLKEAMQGDRTKFPAAVICTPYDKDLSPWTRERPSTVNLDLLARICSKALQYFNKEILEGLDVQTECKALFLPNFKIFNLLIKLHAHAVQNFFMSINAPKSYKIESKEPAVKQASAFRVMPIVGLNIVEQFVKLLESKYSDLAIFFYDRYGQRVIGVILKPESERLLDGDLSKLTSGIKRLGSKLVESIKVIEKES